MNFIHEPVELDYADLKTETKESGRTYLDPEGHSYPSITTVLSILSREAIQKWRARVGEEEANRVSRIASQRGTKVHNVIEKYIANDPDYLDGVMPHNIQTFKDIQGHIDENLNKIFRVVP